MYIRRTVYFPAAGALGEMRQELGSLVRRRQEAGIRTRLLRAEFTPDAPAFVLETEFENLGELEADSRTLQPEREDPGRAVVGTVHSPTRGPERHQLYSVLLPGPEATEPGAWIMQVNRLPLSGKARELGAGAVERARTRQAEGTRISVLSLIVGPGSISLAELIELASLAEWEPMNRTAQSDPAMARLFELEAALQAAPVERQLYEVVAPYAAR